MIVGIECGINTTKYLLSNGSEVSFKREISGSYDTSLDAPEYEDKHKYSLVLSCSKGCNIGCKFCHLTQNGKSTELLSIGDVLSDIQDVIEDQIQKFPELKCKAIKLCWMGEGEPLLHTELIYSVTSSLLDWVFDNGYAKYLDGVDIATSYPRISKDKWQPTIKDLSESLLSYERNPFQDSRSVVRLFYSLHAESQETRDILVPNSKPIEAALTEISSFCDKVGIDFIIHYMFIDGINDHAFLLVNLWRKFNLYKYQLRVLRYNAGVNGWVESQDMKTIQYWLRRTIPDLKFQYSSGKEVKSSCGMFSDYCA